MVFLRTALAKRDLMFKDDPTNRTFDDLEINCFADKNPFLIASSSNNKSFMPFNMNTRHWFVYILTNNNTGAGAACNFIISANNVGIYVTEIPLHEITFDQATGVFINDDSFPYAADRTLGVRYHEFDGSVVVKGWVLGFEWEI